MSTATLTPRQRKLATALAAASHAARAVQGTDDGGTANQDSAFLYVNSMTAAAVHDAAVAAGVSLSRMRTRQWNGWFVHVQEGQGAMRTRMAEAAAKVLTDAGEPACVYYQVD